MSQVGERDEKLKEDSVQRKIACWCLIACLLTLTTTVAAQELMPDLTPVVVDADKGYIEVQNIGNAVAEPSQLFVVCSLVRSGKSAPCVADLHWPGYIEKWNVLSYDIPALQPGSKYALHLFGSGAFPSSLSDYRMQIISDARKRIVESDESNNQSSFEGWSKKIGVEEDGSGLFQVQVLMDGRPVNAAIVVTRPGKPGQVVFETESVPGEPGRKMRGTPFEGSLPVGKYDLYVHAELTTPLKVYLRTKPLPIVIVKGERLKKAVVIPSGRLRLSTTVEGSNVEGLKVEMVGLSKSFKYFSGRGDLKSPFDVTVPAGQYQLRARNYEEEQTRTVNVDIKSGSVIEESLNFDKLHVGYWKLNLTMDGKPISLTDNNHFIDEELFSASTGERVTPLGYSAPMMLRVGTYDVKVHQRAVGGEDVVIKAISIREGETAESSVEIHQPGTLNIVSHWTHQPLNIAACVRYYNPLNPDRWGALMGGHSVSRGKCFSPDVYLAASVSSPGRSDGDIATIERLEGVVVKDTDGRITGGQHIEAIKFVAGVYDVALWPVNRPELEQRLEGVEITSGGVLNRDLEFRWPEQKK